MTRGFVAALALVVAAACDNGPTAPEGAADFASDEFAAFGVDATFDAESSERGGPAGWDLLAAEIPGFAGYYIDRACNVNVLLVDPSLSEKAKELLTPVLRRLLQVRRCPDSATILVHPADFSWLHLEAFLAKLRPLSQVRGVARMGISVPVNRIVIVLETRSIHARIVEEIQALDVPLGAVVIRVLTDSSARTRG
jgi:hypothetical protein